MTVGTDLELPRIAMAPGRQDRPATILRELEESRPLGALLRSVRLSLRDRLTPLRKAPSGRG